jgi:hypothetical protein
MKGFKLAAFEILKEAKTPMHYKEITKKAIEKGLIATDGDSPDHTMISQLSTEIKNKKVRSDFIRTAPGIFALNPNKIEEEIVKPIKELLLEKKIKIAGGFTGKAGEHYVCSELLFRGYNASIMSVDVGMDIIATKNNKLFSLQVKTSNLHPDNSYIFDMRKVSLERDYAGNVFYVFAMLHPDATKSALILPTNEITKLIYDNAIKDLKTVDRFRVTLKIRNGKLFIGTLNNPIDYYWNNWEVIK